MPIVQRYINHDELFEQTSNKIMLNDLQLTDDNLKDLIYSVFNDEMTLVPRCECGELQGAFMLGRHCPNCGTSVTETFDNIQPILWARSFHPDIPFINPEFWSNLTMIISNKVDGLRWLSDTSYNPPNVPIVLHSLRDVIGGRSYMNVVNNLEKIIIYLLHSSQYKTLARQIKLKAIHRVYKEQKDLLLSKHLPLINKNLFVMVNTSKGNYSPILLADIIDQALLVVSTANDINKSEKMLNNNTAKAVASGATLFRMYVKDMVGKKNGLARKNIYGIRINFGMRAVASSLNNKYDYDAVRLPWQIGLTTFRPHVFNKLRKLGFSPRKANKFILDKTNTYDPLIDKILQELIDEAEGVDGEYGIPVLVSRNPSLSQGSIQYLRLIEFKKDTLDNTMDISILVSSSFNADFDGQKFKFSLIAA